MEEQAGRARLLTPSTMDDDNLQCEPEVAAGGEE